MVERRSATPRALLAGWRARRHGTAILRSMRYVLLLALAFVASARGDDKKTPLSVEDLYRLEGPSQAVVSPDGKAVAFVRQWIDRETRQERQSLWIVRGGGVAAPLEPDEPDARLPVFSPDGKWIAFRSTRPRPAGWRQTPPVPLESDPATDIWLIPTAGGAPLPLAPKEKPYGRVFIDPFYGRVAFSPDGTQLVFVADDGVDPRGDDERLAGVTVQRPDQGEGYTGYRPAQIWVAELEEKPDTHVASEIRRLTDDDYWYGDPQWAPNGEFVVVHANRTNDRESVRFSINKNYDLWTIDLAEGTMRALTNGPGPEVSPRWSPDGKRLACLSSPRKGPHADVYNLMIVSPDAAQPETHLVFDHHADRDETQEPAPHPYPTFPLPDVAWEDDGHLVLSAPVGTRTETVVVSIETGEGKPLAADAQNGGAASRELARRTQAVPTGNLLLRDRLLGETTVVQWTSDDGMAIEGVLTTPHESVAKPPYKLLVYPHGGPHSRSTVGFNFTVELFAAHGFAVFQPNFRGSQGYGKRFLDADRGDFGGGDMRDILTGIELLVKRGIVDSQRQFVYGISYGGYMTSWLVGHTRQFRAAVAQNAVTDLQAMWSLSDLQSWVEWEFGGRPWEVVASLRSHSPLTYVDQVTTPTMLLNSREDRRCPLAMGQMFYQGLAQRGIPTRMVVYPNEGHGIRQPKHREDVFRRTLDWFEKWDVEQE